MPMRNFMVIVVCNNMKHFITLIVVLLFCQVSNADWQSHSSDHFRIFYKQDKRQALKAAIVAEKSRLDISKKWFGSPPEWRNKCDIYLTESVLHMTESGNDQALGHTNLTFENGETIRIIIFVRVDLDIVWNDILPHEISHAIIGSHFNREMPRWIDEGMAGQAESSYQLKVAYRKAFRSERRFNLETLMNIHGYPDGAYIDLYYGQSITLVRYLVRLKGEKTFVAFIHSAHKNGMKDALLKHYNLTFAEAEELWLTIPAPKSELLDETTSNK